jgi:hypothetical protein
LMPSLRSEVQGAGPASGAEGCTGLRPEYRAAPAAAPAEMSTDSSPYHFTEGRVFPPRDVHMKISWRNDITAPFRISPGFPILAGFLKIHPQNSQASHHI